MLPAEPQEAIKDSPDLYKYDDSLIFKLPGSGSKRESCGAPFYIGHQDGSQVHWLYRITSCHRKECPICWPDWKKRESLAIQDRIQFYFTNGYTKRRMPVHYVVSPPQNIDYSTRSSYNKMKKEAYRIARKRGIDGGCLIFHERSKRYSDSEEYTSIHCSNGPHFHILGDGWLSPRIKEFFLEDGWIVKNLRIRSFGSVYKTAFYVLDHAAIGYPANSQSSNIAMSSVTWFGAMAYNKLKIERFTGSDTIFCPNCKAEISRDEYYILSWIGDGDPPDGEFGQSDQYERGKNGFMLSHCITSWFD
jgi:hypothetical protein